MAPRIPQFVWPFRLENNDFATAEQDSTEDVVSCVAVVLLHHPGDRELLPKFGTTDLTFQTQPIDVGQIIAAVDTWEPRAAQVLSQMADSLDPLIVQVVDDITTRESIGE